MIRILIIIGGTEKEKPVCIRHRHNGRLRIWRNWTVGRDNRGHGVCYDLPSPFLLSSLWSLFEVGVVCDCPYFNVTRAPDVCGHPIPVLVSPSRLNFIVFLFSRDSQGQINLDISTTGRERLREGETSSWRLSKTFRFLLNVSC